MSTMMEARMAAQGLAPFVGTFAKGSETIEETFWAYRQDTPQAAECGDIDMARGMAESIARSNGWALIGYAAR